MPITPPPGGPVSAAVAKQILFSTTRLGNGGNINNANSTNYISMGSMTISTAEVDTELVMPCAGTVTNLYVRTGSTAATGGESFPVTTFTIRKNGVDTAVTLQLTQETSTTSSDTTHSVEFAAGDLLTISVVTDSSGNSTSFVSISMEFVPL